jgi:hypothetical protein
MTDTGGAPSEDSADAPTPSQGFPRIEDPGSGDGTPSGTGAVSSATPAPQAPAGWQPPTQPPAQPPVQPGYGQGYGPGAPPPYQGGPQARGWTPFGLGKPGVIALRPLNVGDILDGAITAIRRYPLLTLAPGAVISVIAAALNFVLQRLVLDNLQQLADIGPGATAQEAQSALFGALGNLLLLALPGQAITTLLLVVTTGFMSVVMGRAALGRPVTFGSAFSELRPRILPLLGLAFAYAVVTTIGAALCVIPGVIAYVFWALASPALVLERGTFGQALNRSRTLVSGAFWRVFGILLLAGVIQYFLRNIVQLPFLAMTGQFQQLFNPRADHVVSNGDLLLQGVGEVVAGTITTPFVALVTVIIYLDQRMRREGMDIELARAAGVTPPQPW